MTTIGLTASDAKVGLNKDMITYRCTMSYLNSSGTKVNVDIHVGNTTSINGVITSFKITNGTNPAVNRSFPENASAIGESKITLHHVTGNEYKVEYKDVVNNTKEITLQA